MAYLLEIDEEELLTLWLGNKIYQILEYEAYAIEALKVAEAEIKYNDTQ